MIRLAHHSLHRKRRKTRVRGLTLPCGYESPKTGSLDDSLNKTNRSTRWKRVYLLVSRLKLTLRRAPCVRKTQWLLPVRPIFSSTSTHCRSPRNVARMPHQDKYLYSHCKKITTIGFPLASPVCRPDYPPCQKLFFKPENDPQQSHLLPLKIVHQHGVDFVGTENFFGGHRHIIAQICLCALGQQLVAKHPTVGVLI